MSSVCCTNCNGTDIEYDQQRGDAVCIQCGTVLEENTIVNEVTFAQDAGGGSSVVGQFVAATPGLTSSGLGFGKESREVAFSNGQRHISQLAGALRLADHHQEAAQRLFMHAVHNNFIQGRRTQHVIAACLYAVCRREKTPHLLIDYSDVLQTNVYILGSCFLKFVRLLSLTLPIIDPSLFIHRFASKLEFGDKTHLVAMSALRLVQRMKRDWIQTGRRPSGICGAALLIAARVHGFRRTQREVVRVVRICDVTLRKRLSEFCETPLGRLTAAQLESAELETFPAADPPCYVKAREQEESERQALLLSPEEVARRRRAAELSSLRVHELRDRLASGGLPVQGLKAELVGRLVAAELQAEREQLPSALPAPPESAADSSGALAEVHRVLQTEPLLALEQRAGSSEAASGEAASDSATVTGETAAGETAAGENGGGATGEATGAPSPTADGEADGVAVSPWLRHDLLQSREAEIDEEVREEMMAEMNADLEQLDAEVECYLIKDAEEIELKTRVWEEMNKEYLEKQAAKEESARLANEQAEQGGAQAAPPAKASRKRGRKGNAPESSAADAADSELHRNKISSRINYEVVQILSAQNMDDDAASMPDSPGPVGAGFQGGDAFSETLSVHSSMGVGAEEEPSY